MSSPKSGYVYVVNLNIDGLYKIGCTQRLKERMRDLSAANPNIKTEISCQVPKMKKTERFLHRRFSGVLYTRELFRLKDEDISWIKNFLEHQRGGAGTLVELFCPSCNVYLVLRTNNRNGRRFYGCSNYPVCKQTFSLSHDYILNSVLSSIDGCETSYRG